jgi:hypothetical protein
MQKCYHINMKKGVIPKQKKTAFEEYITPLDTDTEATKEVKRYMGVLARRFSRMLEAKLRR